MRLLSLVLRGSRARCCSLDLSPEAYEMVRAVDPASSVIKNARSSLVTRLNTYATEHKDLFAQVIDLINMDFMHILKRQVRRGLRWRACRVWCRPPWARSRCRRRRRQWC